MLKNHRKMIFVQKRRWKVAYRLSSKTKRCERHEKVHMKCIFHTHPCEVDRVGNVLTFVT